jgi:hypothetical protein
MAAIGFADVPHLAATITNIFAFTECALFDVM